MTTRPLDWDRTRGWIAEHFDGKASSWEELTSDRPLGRIRSSVREGRAEMQTTLLSWIPDPVEGLRVFDAGCGPGGLAIELGARGARVLGVDVSAPLIEVARERAEGRSLDTAVELRVGDMLHPAGSFDHVVAMDSLLHYSEDQLLEAVAMLSDRAERSMLFTFAPRTPILGTMHALGRLFPRSERAPTIAPMRTRRLFDALPRVLGDGWAIGRTHRVSRGFYTSQALELRRAR